MLINEASGAVGTFAVQIAKSFGAQVTGVCSTRNVDLVRSIGADQVIDYTKDDFIRAGQRYDVMVDLVGTRPLSDCRRALIPRGTYVMVGVKDMGRVAGARASGQSAVAVAVRAPADAGVRREAQQRRPGCSEAARRSRQGRAGYRSALRLERRP
jgi:NADPH:quinone reductase-like Zn-dependent oxidoreductase